MVAVAFCKLYHNWKRMSREFLNTGGSAAFSVPENRKILTSRAACDIIESKEKQVFCFRKSKNS